MADAVHVLRATALIEAGLRDSTAGDDAPNFETEGGACAYLLRRRTQTMRQLGLVIYLLLACFEQPPYCNGSHAKTLELCEGGKPREALHIWPELMLPETKGLLISLLFLTVFLGDACLHVVAYRHWRCEQRVVGYVYIGLVVASQAELFLRVFLPDALPRYFVPYRILRPSVLAVGFAQARQGVSLVLRAAYQTLWLYAGIAAYLFIATWVAVVLFGDLDESFQSYGSTMLKLTILLTTSNYPDVQTPLVNKSWSAFFFFGAYVVVGVFVLMNVVFSNIYSSYHRMLQDRIKEGFLRRESTLERAFMLLSAGPATEERVVPRDAWCAFYGHWAPKATGDTDAQTRARGIYDRVQRSSTSRAGLDRSEFCALVIALGDKDVAQALVRSRSCRGSATCQRTLSVFLAHHWVQLAIDALLCANLALLAFETSLFVTHQTDRTLHLINFIFTLVWVAELWIRVIAAGGIGRFWHGTKGSFLPRTELAVVLGASITDFCLRFAHHRGFLRAALVLRLMRALRVLGRLRPFQRILQCLVRILPAATTVLNVALVIHFSYAEVGLQLFGGVLRQSNPALVGTEWMQTAYWSNNFNSFASAAMVMFQQLVVNNWFVVMDAVAQSEGTWTRAFFISHYLVGVTVLANVFVAFIVEAWQGQMQLVMSVNGESGPANPPGGDGLAPAAQEEVLMTSRDEPPAEQSTGSLIGAGSLYDAWTPSRNVTVRNMFGEEMQSLPMDAACARLAAARRSPQEYIRAVPGLRRILLHDSTGEAVEVETSTDPAARGVVAGSRVPAPG